MLPEFRSFGKMARLSRDVIITEKIDGTNGLIYINELGEMYIGSRNRWLDEHSDNHGFWHWATENKEELLKLGPGYHYGEVWGKGIQRGYNLEEKRFSLFNVSKWTDDLIRPSCCYIVPVLFKGVFDTRTIEVIVDELSNKGSFAAPGFMQPEGIVIYHTAANIMFKKTIENDEKAKSEVSNA